MEHNKDPTVASAPAAATTETPHNAISATPTPETTANNNITSTGTTPLAGESVSEITTEAHPPRYEEYASKLDTNDIY
jgi:hypothetical protein